MSDWTAVFTRVAHAEAFAARLLDEGMWAKNVARKGRTVTFDDDVPPTLTLVMNFETGEEATVETGPMTWMDRAETVGYYGSPPQGPVATLNGKRTPRSY